MICVVLSIVSVVLRVLITVPVCMQMSTIEDCKNQIAELEAKIEKQLGGPEETPLKNAAGGKTHSMSCSRVLSAQDGRADCLR